MMTAEEAKLLAIENQKTIDETNLENANKFINKILEPLITTACKSGKTTLEKEFSSSELSAYDIPTIKRLLEANGYRFVWSTTRTLTNNYIKFTITWA